LPDGGTRYFNDDVARFQQRGFHGRYNAYRATVRPW
jgi:uncharacterized protein involved in type VI secretion and phage assembly